MSARRQNERKGGAMAGQEDDFVRDARACTHQLGPYFAQLAGFRAGERGAGAGENPFDIGAGETVLANRWRAGWRAGWRERRSPPASTHAAITHDRTRDPDLTGE